MRIGFFGNTNNYPFILARAVRELGHDVVFFVDNSAPLHRPEYRYHDISVPYPHWIRDVSPFRYRHYAYPNLRRTRVVGELKRCDGVILNGLGPSIHHLINRPALALLTGSDLDVFADTNHVDRVPKRFDSFLLRVLGGAVVRWINRRVIADQRWGIRNAVAVQYFPAGLFPHGDALLAELDVSVRQRIFFMIVDLDTNVFQPPPQNSVLRIFCATRFTWKRPLPSGFNDMDDKGSDVMIRGLGYFRRAVGVPLEIRLVRKGLHVAETRELARAEGLEDQVVWLDEMTQKEVRDEFRKADIVLEQFGTSALGMAGLEAMATGRPVIANARPEYMERAIGAPLPICHATTPQQISDQLKRLLDPAERMRVGAESRKYVEEYFSPAHAAQTCIERLAGAMTSSG